MSRGTDDDALLDAIAAATVEETQISFERDAHAGDALRAVLRDAVSRTLDHHRETIIGRVVDALLAGATRK